MVDDIDNNGTNTTTTTTTTTTNNNNNNNNNKRNSNNRQNENPFSNVAFSKYAASLNTEYIIHINSVCYVNITGCTLRLGFEMTSVISQTCQTPDQ